MSISSADFQVPLEVEKREKANIPVIYNPTDEDLPTAFAYQEESLRKLNKKLKKSQKLSDEEELKKALEKFNKWTKKLKELGINIDENKKKKEKLIKPVDYTTTGSFILLPQLGTVRCPILNETEPQPSVGSRYFLQCLDQMRAIGTPKAVIDEFLDQAADVVKRDAFFEVRVGKKGESDRVNYIEQFCQWFPNEDKQQIRIQNGVDKLISDIRHSLGGSGLNPFRPKNNEALTTYGSASIKPKGPPAVTTVTLQGEVFDDFLAKWTAVKRKMNFQEKGGPDYWECVPENGNYYDLAWIPDQYRQRIEELYDLTPFRFCDPEQFVKYMVTLQNAEEKMNDPKNDQWIEKIEKEDGKYEYSILVQTTADSVTENRTIRTFKLKEKGISLNVKSCPDVLTNEITLRDIINCNPTLLEEYYPLLRLMLNVEPNVDNSPTMSDPRYRDYFLDAPSEVEKLKSKIYIYEFFWKDQKGLRQKVKRLSADAPYKVFRELMVAEYGKPIKGINDKKNCVDRFIEQVWKVTRANWRPMSLASEPLPAEVPKFVEDLLRDMMGSEFSCEGSVAINLLLEDKLKSSMPYIPKTTRNASKETLKEILNFLSERVIEWS